VGMGGGSEEVPTRVGGGLAVGGEFFLLVSGHLSFRERRVKKGGA
jgi:hypothetical protein